MLDKVVGKTRRRKRRCCIKGGGGNCGGGVKLRGRTRCMTLPCCVKDGGGGIQRRKLRRRRKKEAYTSLFGGGKWHKSDEFNDARSRASKFKSSYTRSQQLLQLLQAIRQLFFTCARV